MYITFKETEIICIYLLKAQPCLKHSFMHRELYAIAVLSTARVS